MATLTLTAFAATTASAEGPPECLPTSGKFTSKSGAGKFEGKNALAPIECTADTNKTKYRTWTVAIVLAGLRGDRSVAEVCREHEISENLFYSWREKLLEGGAERLSGKEERTELVELRKRVRDLERTLGRKTYELEILGNGFRSWE
jgi:transposase